MDPIINSLRKIRTYNSEYRISGLRLETLIPTTLQNYYTYNGSLTTPSCDEVVTWLVADSPVIGISEDQLIEFQTILDKNKVPVSSEHTPLEEESLY